MVPTDSSQEGFTQGKPQKEEGPTFGILTDPINRGNTWVLQVRTYARLEEEPRPFFGFVGHPSYELLERHLAPQVFVLRPVDPTEAALA